MVQNLKALREEHGISQETLGKAVGVSQQSIYKYESQETEPSIDILIQLAKLLHTSVDYLVGNTENRLAVEHLGPATLTYEETCFLDAFRLLTDDEKQSLYRIMKIYNEYKSRISVESD